MKGSMFHFDMYLILCILRAYMYVCVCLVPTEVRRHLWIS